MADRYYTGTIDLVQKGKTPKIIQHLIADVTNNSIASAYLTTNQTLAHNVAEKLSLTESLDLGRRFSASRYTVPTDGKGYYQIGWRGYGYPDALGDTPVSFIAILRINGANDYYGSFTGDNGGYGLSVGSKLIYLSDADYLELWGLGSTAGGGVGTFLVAAGDGYTSLDVVLVSK